MSEWHDISTAPKDGTRVLVYCRDHIRIGHWSLLFGQWAVTSSDSRNEEREPPTHWQPLPTPPEQRTGT